MIISLPDIDATRTLGRAFARILERNPFPVFFFGGLGAGKTTLISALVKALPGGENAETSSPSFTLCNMYATIPPVAHFDLYRQENGAADESLLDFLDGQRHLMLVEWAERLPGYALPPVRFSCELRAAGNGREASLTAEGAEAADLLDAVRAEMCSHTVFSRENP